MSGVGQTLDLFRRLVCKDTGLSQETLTLFPGEVILSRLYFLPSYGNANCQISTLMNATT